MTGDDLQCRAPSPPRARCSFARPVLLSSELYFRLAAELRAAAAPHPVDIHVFSSLLEGAWTSQDFDGFRSRDMQVHLDGNITLHHTPPLYKDDSTVALFASRGSNESRS